MASDPLPLRVRTMSATLRPVVASLRSMSILPDATLFPDTARPASPTSTFLSESTAWMRGRDAASTRALACSAPPKTTPDSRSAVKTPSATVAARFAFPSRYFRYVMAAAFNVRAASKVLSAERSIGSGDQRSPPDAVLAATRTTPGAAAGRGGAAQDAGMRRGAAKGRPGVCGSEAVRRAGRNRSTTISPVFKSAVIFGRGPARSTVTVPSTGTGPTLPLTSDSVSAEASPFTWAAMSRPPSGVAVR